MSVFYEDALGTAFWDYSDVPFNVHGRVCLPFSIAWGLLSIPLSLWVHPWLKGLHFSPPPVVTALMALAFGADVLLSCALVIRSGTRESLNW